MSDNWIVQNLENALNTWNEKLSEIWTLITQSPETFKGGSIWNVVVNIHGALQAIGYALLVLFFVIGVVKTCGSFAEVKKPEHALKLFVRFAIAKGLITYGMDLMLALLEIIQGVINSIMNAAGFGSPQATVLPQEIVTAVEDCGFFESIPLWAVTLIGGLFIWVLSFIMILSVYGRFFKMYMYTAIAPIPLSSFAGEPSQSIGKSFLKSYAAVCLEGAIIVLACIIFSVFASSPPVVDASAAAASMVWSDRNLPITPDAINEKAQENVWWHCKTCGFEWKSQVKSRVRGAACPVCADRAVLPGYNDLATTDPALMCEWDTEKNKGIMPESISRNSLRSVWWKCAYGHQWKARIRDRAIDGLGCSVCEKEFHELVPQLLIILYAGRQGMKPIINSDAEIGIPLEAYIPELGLAIESSGATRAGAVKDYICSKRHIKLIRIPHNKDMKETAYAREIKKAFQKAHIYI